MISETEQKFGNGISQEWVLAKWREDSSKNDPLFYTVKKFWGKKYIWMSIYGNIGWYLPEIKGEDLVGIRQMGSILPSDSETKEEKNILDYNMRWVNPKQRRKIVNFINQFND